MEACVTASGKVWREKEYLGDKTWEGFSSCFMYVGPSCTWAGWESFKRKKKKKNSLCSSFLLQRARTEPHPDLSTQRYSPQVELRCGHEEVHSLSNLLLWSVLYSALCQHEELRHAIAPGHWAHLVRMKPVAQVEQSHLSLRSRFAVTSLPECSVWLLAVIMSKWD